MRFLGKTNAIDASASKPKKHFSSGPSQVSSRQSCPLRSFFPSKSRFFTLFRLPNRSRSMSVTQSQSTTDLFQPQAAPPPYKEAWYPVLDVCGQGYRHSCIETGYVLPEPDFFPFTNELSCELRLKSYAWKKVPKITFDQSIIDRDRSESIRRLEEKFFQLLDKHRFDLKDWPQL